MTGSAEPMRQSAMCRPLDANGREPRVLPIAACCLPSGLSPSVLEFHQVNRPLAAVGSRTVTAGSELHRPRSTHCCHCITRYGAIDALYRFRSTVCHLAIVPAAPQMFGRPHLITTRPASPRPHG